MIIFGLVLIVSALNVSAQDQKLVPCSDYGGWCSSKLPSQEPYTHGSVGDTCRYAIEEKRGTPYCQEYFKNKCWSTVSEYCAISNSCNYDGCGTETCEPEWKCGEWGNCDGVMQSRSCTDSGNCGTSKGKPETSRICSTTTVVSPKITAVDGKCGGANGVAVSSKPVSNLCNTGTASDVSGTGPWLWTCGGLNGGTNVDCSAPKIQETTKQTEPKAECIENKRADFDGNGQVDFGDSNLFSQHFNKVIDDKNRKYDLNDDNEINLPDLWLLQEDFGKDICGATLSEIKTSEGIVAYYWDKIVNAFRPNHCRNDKKDEDEDEEGVDCGGSCGKCLDINPTKKGCKDVPRGGKCEFIFNVKVNAKAGSSIKLPVEFVYSKDGKEKRFSKESTLVVSGVKGSSNGNVLPPTTRTVLDISGSVVQNTNVESQSRFNCVLKPMPSLCCPIGTKISEQDSSKCVRDEKVPEVIEKQSNYQKFVELATKRLELQQKLRDATTESERREIEAELDINEADLRNL